MSRDTNYEPWDNFWLWVARTVPASWIDEAPLPVYERIQAAVGRRRLADIAWFRDYLAADFERLGRIAVAAFAGLAAAAVQATLGFDGIRVEFETMRREHRDWFDADGYLKDEA